jgi:hypothetical protein
MSENPPSPRLTAAQWLPWFVALGALAPLLWCWTSFHEVWWFGDEWDQLDQISRQGFWSWVLRPFGENVVPVFKTAWGAMAFASGGSYFPMLAAVWLTHAVNTALLARIMRSTGFAWAGTVLACTLFSLTVANAEVLAWSIQWSNALAVLFLLAGLDRILRYPPGSSNKSTDILVVLCAAASALTFVRGILSGLVFGLGALFLTGKGRVTPGSRWRQALLYLAPAVAVMVWVFAAATGNHHDLGRAGFWPGAIQFGAWFWAAVPFHRLLEISSWDGRTVLLLGLAKGALTLWALAEARGPQRQLLALLLLFDLGNAALLGIGRYHTGLQFANSSRYYYSSLVCVTPFLGFLGDRLGARLPGGWRTAVAAVVIAAAAAGVARKWPGEARLYAERRGRDTRHTLLVETNLPAEGAVPGIPFMQTRRAKELISIYHLH